MGKQKSFRSKAVHFVSDLTTVFLNPISDKPSKSVHHHHHHPSSEEESDSKSSQLDSNSDEEDTGDSVNGPDTSSFTAFLYSLLTNPESNTQDSDLDKLHDSEAVMGGTSVDTAMKENKPKRSLFSRGKRSIRSFYIATKFSSYKTQERRVDSENEDDNGVKKFDGLEMRSIQSLEVQELVKDLPGVSEPSLLLSEQTRRYLHTSLPTLVQGRKWLLLYSTWRHGVSLSTLYRRSMLWPGLSLLVVGDRKGAVFGGLVEAPLKPTNKRKYQGTNSTYVFTDKSGPPALYRPTGANRYFTLCSSEFLAIGGGSHFALYLDGDLLSGSSSVSETYGNPCLSHTEEFEVKDVELWGFVYGPKFDEVLAESKIEAPGISRW